MATVHISICGQSLLQGRPFQDKFDISDGEKLLFCNIPLGESAPLCCYVKCENGKVICDSPLIRNICWNEHTYEFCRERTQDVSAIPIAVAQQSIVYKGLEYQFTAYREGKIRVLLEGGGIFINHTPYPAITEPQLSIMENGGKLLCTIYAKTDEKEYLLIIGCDGKSAEILLEVVGDTINAFPGEVTVLNHLNDMRGRCVTAKYISNGNRYVKHSNMNVCTNEHIYIREMSCYLLLEAVMAKDADDIKRLVTPDLAADTDALISYVGNVERLSEPSFIPHRIGDVAAIKKTAEGGYTAVIYRCEDEMGKISNLIEV